MNRTRTIRGVGPVLALLGIGLLMSAPAFATKDQIMPIREVKPGLKGLGKTVIRGRAIETFNVEVLGIVSNNKINENMVVTGNSILVRVSGKAIDESGGIAAGMSGSPVYINGKLIGGLSSGWVMTDHTVGMVTPIEEMMEIWNYPQSSAHRPWRDDDETVVWRPQAGTVSLPGHGPLTRLVEIGPDASAEPWLADGTPVFRRCRAPVVVQGLTGGAVKRLKQRLSTQGIQAAPVPPASIIPGPPQMSPAMAQLEPGSAIGIQLARGDVNVTTLGTLTYRDGKRVLGLAHPFLKKGRVAYFLTGAEIHHSFSSVQMPFKVGAPTELVGTIVQDREKGVAGELNRFPPAVPVKLEVNDLDLGKTKMVTFQVVRDPELMVGVIESTVLQTIESIVDRTGAGTAVMTVNLTVGGKDAKPLSMKRANMVVSKTDVTGAVIDQVLECVNLVLDNEIEDAVPLELSVQVTIEKRKRTATIEKVEIKNSSVTTGGLLEVWITLRPYREPSQVRKAKIVVPQEIGKEGLKLMVFGRGNLHDADNSTGTEKSGGERGGDERDGGSRESLAQLLSAASSAPANSDIILEFRQEGEDDAGSRATPRNFQVVPTPYFILGHIETTIGLGAD